MASNNSSLVGCTSQNRPALSTTVLYAECGGHFNTETHCCIPRINLPLFFIYRTVCYSCWTWSRFQSQYLCSLQHLNDLLPRKYSLYHYATAPNTALTILMYQQKSDEAAFSHSFKVPYLRSLPNSSPSAVFLLES